MTQVDFELTTSVSDTYINITLGEDDVIEAYEEAFGDYCWICRNVPISHNFYLCCGCLKDEMKKHMLGHDCLEEALGPEVD